MTLFYFLLYVAAAVCFGIAAFASRQPTRVNLVAAGLLAWVLVPLIDALISFD